ncbi:MULTISPECIES: DUF445 family protein [unclassified Paenibacillus]|uniref:DUF445 domain-containing protein n=1 Tax=unclassified Paenibacillus TaxID=185978 RepID=UPI001AE215E7|nr:MULTISPECIES: DUF445 family protein [unclassified Paenibacillus]MBP1154586.1 uncharacterized membrane protein YheB (UPF0754 family) [Paenibacillus sp. PvP091]MBP1170030.1 uncharacterized membrane protein YheB (UPF0754 family) [Paenibacillus sp. PvR098]MBP2441058.1 uncharacterized membrane protein YheB (UPF0754 family) [Paenibacillus sp. PvP052]
MSYFWFILVNIMVAGFVGGVTNHLAIKMLFHPRHEWRLFGRRVPFTPGLIPKRKGEIGGSLGKVVGDYLVTARGLSQMLQRAETKDRLEQTLRRIVTDWTSREITVRELILRWVTPEKADDMVLQLAGWLRERTGRGIEWLWRDKGFGDVKLAALLPDWSEEKRERFVDWGVEQLIDEIKKEMMSPNGDRMLRQMTNQFMGQTGGFLGALAGMFMDEAKTVEKIRTALLEQLDSVNVRLAIGNFIRKKVQQFEGMSLSILLESIAKEESLPYLKEQAQLMLHFEEWLHKLGEVRLDEALARYRDTLLDYTPQAADRALTLLANNVERIMQGIELPKIVEEQVAQFPIEWVEEIILSVSGKEFRAITWLGVLLGGIIGLIQSLVVPWFYS